tara:strand:- start:1936 stop:3348 length:1413 start_codon:yes stop_codon:yes gene_type:complete
MEDILDLEVSIQQEISSDQAYHYCIIPKEFSTEQISFYASTDDAELKDELEMVFGKEVLLIKTDEAKLKRTLAKYYRNTNKRSKETLNYDQEKDFLRKLIDEANKLGSSDIHIEPYADKCRVRIRIDGKLVERYQISIDDFRPIVNRIKIMSHLDIAEKRLPQDGRIEFVFGDSKFDIRVSVLPTLFGEKIVLRLLSRDGSKIDLTKLGFQKEELEIFKESIKKPNGVILISGPTGSGKTTTLYATLKLLNEESRNILTIEDPIEYTIEGVNQVQLRENIGLDFSAAMKTFLRQDPDVIMIGEIRDVDTAQMAIRAALTGHLVFSTIHTNSAIGTITRLIDMGVPAFLIASTFNLSAAQRLVRKLCRHCKIEKKLDSQLWPKSFKPTQLVEFHTIPIGCDSCHYTGYKGRVAIYELLNMDSEISDIIKKDINQLQQVLQPKGFKTLSDRAFELIQEGETSIEEVYSILMN